MSAPQPSTVPEVIERLRMIEAAVPRSDGVACFARLYRQVTEGVNAELGNQSFEDGRFLERLDICFAGLFFSALDAYGHDPSGRAICLDAAVCAAVAARGDAAAVRPGWDERAHQPRPAGGAGDDLP